MRNCQRNFQSVNIVASGSYWQEFTRLQLRMKKMQAIESRRQFCLKLESRMNCFWEVYIFPTFFVQFWGLKHAFQ